MLKYIHIGRNMLIIDKYFKLYMKRSLSAYGLNMAEGMVLLVFYGQEGDPAASQDQLIDELHYDKGVMTRTMQSLESKGYLVRQGHPKDNRSFVFTLTKRAIDFRDSLFEILKQWNDALLQGIDQASLEFLQITLTGMVQNALNLLHQDGTE